MQKTIEQQIKSISTILGTNTKTCLDCNKNYTPKNRLETHLCPFCQEDEFNYLDEMEIVYEEVNHEELEV